MISGWALAQAPVITNIDLKQSYAGSKVVISGSGFSATPANLDVWFGSAHGIVTASSDFSIEVTVPPYAKTENIEVINKVSKLSAKSSFKFSPYFSGEAFDASKFGGAVSFSGATNEVFDLCTCDFDLDGKPDIAATKQGLASDMLILRNTSTIGNLAFTQTTLALGSPTFNSACGDLNGDNKPDIVATRGGATRNEVFVRLNTSGAGISFAATTSLLLDVSHVAFRLSIRDLNSDGKPEIIVSNAFQAAGNVIYVFVNQSTGGTLSINPTPVKITVPEASSSYGLDVQDLDGDNLPEIIFNQFNNPDIFILKNTFSGNGISFAAAQKIALPGTLNHLTTADFNNDNKLDIAVTNSTVNNKVHVLLNQSSGGTISFGAAKSFNTGDGPWGLDATDIDGDQDIDLVIGNIDFTPATADTELTALINNGNFANVDFTATTFNVGKKTRNVEVGDFDGDAKPDLAFTTVSGNSIDVQRNQICYVPQVLNVPPVTICNGQTVVLNGLPNPAATYQWLESGGAIPSNTSSTLSITTAGSYTLTGTTEGGTCVKTTTALIVTTDAASVTQDPTILNATAGVISTCIGSSLQLNTSDTDPGFTWTGPNGFTSSQQNNTINNVTTAHAGVYTLQLSNGQCKSNIATVRVDVANLQSFNINSNVSSNTICAGGSLTLSTTGQSGFTYQWIKDGSDINTQTGTSLVVTQEGSYKLRVTSPAPLLCSSETNAINVVALTQPVAAFTAPANGCVGQNVAFTDQSTFDNRGTPTYSWNFGDAGTATTASPTHVYNSVINANVGLTVGYSGVSGCTANTSKSVNVIAPANPSITASAMLMCDGEVVDLSIPATYTAIAWTGGATTAATTITTAGTYTVTAKDVNGCSTTAQVVIGNKPTPNITITTDPNPPSVLPGIPVTLHATGAEFYDWLPKETLDNATLPDPVATPLATTTYTVTGSVTDGCSATATVTVEINGELKVTNAFTPNGDGFNDLWVIPGGIETLGNCTLTLFDSFGSKIFEKRGYQNDWDGTFNGKKVPRGTYYYIVNCPDKTPQTGHLLVAY